MAQVAVGEREVVWSSFEQPRRRGRWSYDEMPELTFARAQYEAALVEAQALRHHPPPPLMR
jgi:hypothetical protein